MILALLLFGLPLRELMVPEDVVSVSEIAQTATDFYLFDTMSTERSFGSVEMDA